MRPSAEVDAQRKGTAWAQPGAAEPNVRQNDASASVSSASPMERLAVTVPGLLAVLASLALGAEVWGPTVAGICYVVALWLPRSLSAILLLGGPLVMAVALPFDSFYSVWAAAYLVVVLTSVVPFFRYVGRSLPWRLMPWFAGVAVVVFLAMHVIAPFEVYLIMARSDITARAQGLLLLLAVLVAEAGVWYWRRRNKTP